MHYLCSHPPWEGEKKFFPLFSNADIKNIVLISTQLGEGKKRNELLFLFAAVLQSQHLRLSADPPVSWEPTFDQQAAANISLTGSQSVCEDQNR